ncbi:MAG: Na/Pi cotransporter family protein [Vicingaceae bacterium]
MDFNLFDTLTLIGALGFFIYGMKVMSEGIQKAAGSKLRQILGAMTQNRYFGVLTGFLITALVQSSSATTVMTVSFVNAGLLSLMESAGVMMGANIGTTVTAWMISIFGFKVKIAAITLPIIAIAFPMLFSKRSRTKSLAEFLIGFALLFMGLDALKTSVPDLKNNPQVLAFLSGYTDMGYLSSIMFIGIGALVTIIIQSSSASMALTLVMCNSGWIPLETAAAMVLGENIGTTITAELASLVGNVHAKRSARIHSLFNIIGVTWMIFLMPLYIEQIVKLVVWSGMNSPYDDPESIPIALSYFHTAFNASNVLLLIWFVPNLVQLATKTVPSKGDNDEQFHLEYLGTGPSSTSELSMVEANREVIKLGKLIHKMSDLIPKVLFETDKKKFNKMIESFQKYEDIADRMEVEISTYLLKASEGEISDQSTLELRAMLAIITDLERVADLCYEMSRLLERKAENKIYFTPEQRNNLIAMYKLLEVAIVNMEQSIKLEDPTIPTQKAKEIEDTINAFQVKLREEYLDDVSKGNFTVQSGIIYNDLFSAMEKIGDHLANVSDSIALEKDIKVL